jgi:2-oxoglutarate/2-oxoacid ferredoxin oxidoreductase subunit beta
MTTFIPTVAAPPIPSRKVAATTPELLLTEDHHFCPGCGEPVALRLLCEVVEELDLQSAAIGVVGHGCYGGAVTTLDVDILQCLHGRAPAAATGIKRMRPGCAVFTVQGDGDMVSEGLQEVLHAAARGERITCILLNNGVFGDTGGQMTAATVVGQRTKNTIDGREAAEHGYPIPVSELVAQLAGAAFVARGSVESAGAVANTKRLVRQAFETQMAGTGFSMVEILVMCPTGWFVPAGEGARYMGESLGPTYPLGVLTGDAAPE